MTDKQIIQLRLYNQHISRQVFSKPAEIVEYMGAMQAQDYAGAKWAVGLRLLKSSDTEIDKALADGAIIRTHVLRPTWHFVVPADLRWMLDISAPRIAALAAGRYRQLKLDSAVFKKSNDTLAKALAGGRFLDRFEISRLLQQAGVETNELRFVHLLMQAELDKVICSGPRVGKQFTYALFDDRVPTGKDISREDALASLVKRYFTSRGPATLHDFAWWSGLTLADTRLGIGMPGAELKSCDSGGKTYWVAKGIPDSLPKTPPACLLPAYDEFAVAYADRSAIIDPKYREETRHVIFDPSVIVDGRVAGTWKRAMTKTTLNINISSFGEVSKSKIAAIEIAGKKLGKFLGASNAQALWND